MGETLSGVDVSSMLILITTFDKKTSLKDVVVQDLPLRRLELNLPSMITR